MNPIVATSILAVASILLAPVAHTAEPPAADRTTARELAQQGQEALWANDYAIAAERFSRAYEIVHAPTVLLGLARANAGLHRFVEANEAYTRILREGVAPNAPKAFQKAYEEARKEAAAVAARLSWLVVTVEGPSRPNVVMDGAPLPLAALGIRWAANPGAHEIGASGDGFVSASHTVRLTEGQTTTVALQLSRAVASAQPAAPSRPAPVSTGESAERPSSARRTASYVAFAAGGAGVIAGAITGLMAMQENNRLRELCPNGVCGDDQKARHDRYTALGLASTIGFGVGLAGAGVGLYLFLSSETKDGAPKSQAVQGEILSVHIEPLLGFSMAGVRGSF